MGLLLFYILLALGVSFLCSVMEAVLLTIPPSYVILLEKEGGKLGQRLSKLKKEIDTPLAAILSLNTIAHTIGAAGAGAQAAVVFKSLNVAAFSAILTLLILILSEIIPKTLGAVYWRQLAPMVVRALRMMIVGLWPLVKLSQLLTRVLSRGKKSQTISREAFSALAEVGEQEGVIEEEERRFLQHMLRFRSLKVSDVMTPRTVIFSLHKDASVGDVIDNHKKLNFSRIPIYNDNHEDIEGYILKDDLLLHAAKDQLSTPLAQLQRNFLTVAAHTPLPSAFEGLMKQSEHIALVVDEYGGVAGLVTVEDVIETLLGLEIVDEADYTENMQEFARKRWRERAQRLGIKLDETSEEPEEPEESETAETAETDGTAEAAKESETSETTERTEASEEDKGQ